MKIWSAAIFATALYCLTQVSAVYGLNFINQAVAGGCTLLAMMVVLVPQYRHYSLILFVVFIVGFPAYAADPYLDNYVPPFQYGRFAALVSLLGFSSLRITKAGLILPFLLIFSTIIGEFYGRIGSLKAEIFFVGFAIYALNVECRDFKNAAQQNISTLIQNIFFLLPVMAIFSLQADIYTTRLNTSNVYFFGHWTGIIATLALYSILTERSHFKTLKLFFAVVSLAFVATSLQSVHYIMLIIVLLAAVGARVPTKNIIMVCVLCGLALVSIVFVGNQLIGSLDKTTWLYFKLEQVQLLFAGSIYLVSNSVLTRIAEFVSLVEQGNVFTYLFGLGVSATYHIQGEIWAEVILHDASFPEEQLRTSIFQYIHETPVMIFKWGGIVSMILLSVATYRLVPPSRDGIYQYRIMVVLFLLLMASSIHTGLLILGFLIMARSKHV